MLHEPRTHGSLRAWQKGAVATGGLAAILSFASAVAQPTPLPKLRISAYVVDESGNPLSGAKVKLVFGEANNADTIVKTESLTDAQGKVVGEGYSGGSVGATVTKSGYYRSGLSVPPLTEIIRRHPQEVEGRSILRPIKNPIAMYAKSTWLNLPLSDRPCGFDLEKGDWVAPYGRGVMKDLILTLERHFQTQDDFEVTVRLSFANPADGIQETAFPDISRNSVFKWQREAPETGYQPTLISRLSHEPGKGYEATAEEKQNFLFRIRTTRQDGKITGALYGKIRGGLQLAPADSKTCKIRLTYYLNPTPLDRNLEWDPKRNLMPNLSFEQTPRDP